MRKRVENGQVYWSADGGRNGVVVLDAELYRYCEDVVVKGFTSKGFTNDPYRIDAWKLAHCRYYLVETLPDWAPKELKNET